MKIPAEAIAAAFAEALRSPVQTAGELCGLALVSLRRFCPSSLSDRDCDRSGCLQRLALGAALSTLCWTLLGILGARIAQPPLPPDHVVTLLDNGRVDSHSPVRSRGTLRDECRRQDARS
jgi:hypothetical protein